MSHYHLSWITNQLAVGHAPMSYDDLDFLRQQGIGAIVNLCAEFCDLHEIEQKQGFEVYYLPVVDNEAPSEASLEKGLDWLDEAIYLGKKVLVHCRHGIGRTGTFVTAYLLRKGFGLKLAKQQLKNTRAEHSSFSQWWLLRKYGKKSGQLTIREPSLENRNIVDLGPFFQDYELLLSHVDDLLRKFAADNPQLLSCGLETSRCCYEYLEISFIEAGYLNHNMNKRLASGERNAAIEMAREVGQKIRRIKRVLAEKSEPGSLAGDALREAYKNEQILCPLNVDDKCILYPYRPLACRLYGWPLDLRESPHTSNGATGALIASIAPTGRQLQEAVERIANNMLVALSSTFASKKPLAFTLADCVSGRFIQKYFEFLCQSEDSNLAVCDISTSAHQ